MPSQRNDTRNKTAYTFITNVRLECSNLKLYIFLLKWAAPMAFIATSVYSICVAWIRSVIPTVCLITHHNFELISNASLSCLFNYRTRKNSTKYSIRRIWKCGQSSIESQYCVISRKKLDNREFLRNRVKFLKKCISCFVKKQKKCRYSLSIN